jgi:Mrp family chromosome partitioning ATPase
MEAQMAMEWAPAPEASRKEHGAIDETGEAERRAGAGQRVEGRRQEGEENPPILALSTEGRKAFFLVARDAPEAYLQQFRQLRSRLFRLQETLQRQRTECRSLLVTSPSPGEGKSFVAMNLALMMAVAPECRILLADCNVRRPSFAERFRIPDGAGLREALRGASWQSVARKLPGTSLHVMGLGQEAPMVQDPLDYQKLKGWMNRVQSDFDWIVLDGPSLQESPDAEMLSYTADRTLLVIRKGETPFEAMDHCLSWIDDTLLAGVVFNR